ncbi:MAG: TIGR03960 family B12-binding radical SAM protein [Clostridiales bacterium]|nr:TIGR03960 family B12-binding radical SAM protein [Clostridiales bacterium]
MTITGKLRETLLKCEKPGRYTGNEINMAVKDPGSVAIRYAFCFPDLYEVGMSHLGLQLLYSFINEREDTYCERAFAPWPDMEGAMREAEIPLYALETGDPLKSFDMLGFTLQYEMSYTNVLNMLDLAGIHLFASERGEDEPLVCAGGPCAVNPEPLADFMDFFCIGEGEPMLDGVLTAYKENKASGGTKLDFLERIAGLDGVYVPRFYDVSYNEDGTIKEVKRTNDHAPEKAKRAWVKDFSRAYYPKSPLVPLIEVVHDRVSMEAFRGCLRGCRFCQAGFIYRPVRERDLESLMEQAEEQLKSTGHEEISMLALSFSDYGKCVESINRLTGLCTPSNVNISLPSLRIDEVSIELMSKTREVRRAGITFAPEAGSQRLRDAINKGLNEDDILNGASLAFNAGWNKVKLYFMIGLPTETLEDAKAIGALSDKIAREYYKVPRKRPLSLKVSVSCFVPKPFTPFQWAPQDTVEEFEKKQMAIKQSITRKQVSYNYHEAEVSFIEAVLARGDRRCGMALYYAHKLGARFEGWTEYFKGGIWEEAFAKAGLDLQFFACRQRKREEILPWDIIDIGVSKQFFSREMDKAESGLTTPNCRDGCGGCGLNERGGACVG